MKFLQCSIAAMASAFSLVSCVDNAYDLSDIDTTVRVDVNSLVIPINLDEIQLKSIFDIDTDDPDAKVKLIDGQYVVLVDGTFDSQDNINIGAFIISVPELEGDHIDIAVPGGAAVTSGEFPFRTKDSKFEYHSNDIPSSILSLKDIKGEISLDIIIKISGVQATGVTLKDMRIKLPKGFMVRETPQGKYDPATGIFSLNECKTTGLTHAIKLVADGIDYEQSGAVYDYGSHSLELDDVVSTSGLISVSASDVTGTISNLALDVDYIFTDMDVTAISGELQYDIEGINATDVVLNDLPDVLSQPGTNIKLVNPQLYINLKNPLYPEQRMLDVAAGITIRSYYDGVEIQEIAPDGGMIESGDDVNGEYNFCLAPAEVSNDAYPNAKFVRFTKLSDILWSEDALGMPQSLTVELSSPYVSGDVTDLRLGQDLGMVCGKYTFHAPIALKDGSTIVYTDVMDGWSNEDLDNMTITTLDITATITSQLPIRLDFKAYPIDVDGNQINNVKIEGAKIAATGQPQDVKIHITGAITHLDGIRFTADAVANSSEEVLREDMTIKVEKVRPCVSGYYEKEL